MPTKDGNTSTDRRNQVNGRCDRNQIIGQASISMSSCVVMTLQHNVIMCCDDTAAKGLQAMLFTSWYLACHCRYVTALCTRRQHTGLTTV